MSTLSTHPRYKNVVFFPPLSVFFIFLFTTTITITITVTLIVLHTNYQTMAVDFNYVQDKNQEVETESIRENNNNPTITSSSSFDIKSYIDSHPGAIKGLFSGYSQDIEALLDGLGPARGLAESKIQEKCPWLWDAVYSEPDSDLPPPSKSNGNRHRVLDPDPEEDDEEDPEIDQDTWREAMEYALSLRDDHIPPGVISDKLYKHYGIDLHHTQISKTLNEYRLDQRADRYDTLYKPPGRSRTNDSILLKVSSLMADKKGLESKITELLAKQQTPIPERIGLIRKAFRWLW